jgi:hypothetical protein
MREQHGVEQSGYSSRRRAAQGPPKRRREAQRTADLADSASKKYRPDVLFVTASTACGFSAETERAKRTFGCTG